ncbi:TcpE family conjugal transfer membrane protein [Herbidospora sp. RD11066]
MDLPTYTNIWRIEKRLYKLYDLRLPMPLPIVWIGVFVGVSAFWWVLLQMVGLPFDAPWHVIYLVPPGIVTWLSTRPVIENKRLTELMQSQARYLSEPKTWCRLAPSGEPDVIDFQAKVWRASTVTARVKKPKLAPEPQRATVRPAVAAAAAAATPLVEEIPVRVKPPQTATATAQASQEPARRLIGHPDDKQTTFPGDAPDPRRRPASFGQPPRLVRPVADPAAPAKDPSRPFAANPLRPAFLAHPSDKPKARPDAESPTPEEPARSTMESRPEPRTPEVPARPAAESVTQFRGPSVSSRAAAEAARGRRASETPARPVPQVPAEFGRPAPENAPRPEAPGIPAHPVTRTPDVPVRPAAEHRSHAEAADVPSRPVRENGQRPVEAARAEEPSGGPVQPVEAVGQGAGEQVAAQFVQEENPVESGRPARHSAGVAGEAKSEARGGRHAAPGKPAVPPARVEPVAEAAPVEAVSEVAAEPQVPAPAQEPPAAEEVSSPPIRPDALRRLRRLAASADSAVEPEAPAPSGDWQKERLRKGQPPAPFIPTERGSEATWRRVSQVVAGSDGDNDEDRARTAINGSRRIVVLGCTGGAGQTTTTLLLGHSLARLREDGVVAVDANSGGDGLTGRISPETTETLSSFLTAVDSVGTRVRAYTTKTDSGLDVLAADVDPGAEQRIGDRGWFSDQRIARAMRLLDQQYRIILMDPAAALAARLLSYADQLVLVAPASADAPDSVAMTYDWLDGHGCADLRRRAVVVINGVSRRSMADVERAETVARGRCRAIVRVPWEDELAEPGQVDLNDLRSGGRRAYVALAGVVASGLTTARGESFVG